MPLLILDAQPLTPPSTSPPQQLVYGEVQCSLVFVPYQTAVDLAAIHQVAARSTTWGDFMNALPLHRRQELVDILDAWEMRVQDADTISADDIGVLGWPEWTFSTMIANQP